MTTPFYVTRFTVCAVISLACWATAAPPQPPMAVLLPLDGSEKVAATYGRRDANRFLKTTADAAHSVDGRGSLHFGATAAAGIKSSQYFGITLFLAQAVDLSRRQLVFQARTNHPRNTAAFYIRAYNRGEKEPAWSFNSWGSVLKDDWREFRLQPDLSHAGLSWEPDVVEDRVANAVDRIEFIIGTRVCEVPIDVLLDDLRVDARWQSIDEIAKPHGRQPNTLLVDEGEAMVTILHPDSAAGKEAAATVASAIAEQAGVTPTARAGLADDRIPAGPTIVLGNVDNNPAMLLLYARYFTAADGICPGGGGWMVHSVCDPFGNGDNVVVAGASDDAGLAQAAGVLAKMIAAQPKSNSLTLPRCFEKHYSSAFLKRFGWADDAPDEKRLQEGLKLGRGALDQGQHTSIAGVLDSVAQRYRLTGHSTEAKLYVALWDLYTASALDDPRKFGGPWGFDSDFPSGRVVAGWDLIEDDPALTDAERLRTTKSMARWLKEAVIPKCAGAATSNRVLFNHQTFPGLGALLAGLYFSQHYQVAEGPAWLGIADAMFKRQAGYFKVYEDCNGYQWLTNGHLMRYCLARPDFTLFNNGNAARINDYLIGTMDNLGYQVPYGDTGSWQCTSSELVCLDMFAHATGSPEARWAANWKRALRGYLELNAFCQVQPGSRPNRYDGVIAWQLEPQYAASHPDAGQPPLERCFDKISFRAAMDPDAAYLLLDGLSNGGHKHLDGNSLLRLTLFDRIWLADNDYYKSPVKFHNSVTVFRDGQSDAIPPYAELLGCGESPRYGFSQTRLAGYAGADWVRTIVWLKREQAFAVFDRLTALGDDEYQFRTLWHGVGAAKLSDQGLLLTQKGPSLWIQIAPGPVLELRDDTELGANWRGYRYADPVVRSLEAVASVKLAKGSSYLFAGVLHGKAQGVAQPWKIAFLDGSDGIRLDTGDRKLDLLIEPATHVASRGGLQTDAKCVVVADRGLTLLGATHARAGGDELLRSVEAANVDLDTTAEPASLQHLATRGPVPNLVVAADAPRHAVRWSVVPRPDRPAGEPAAPPCHFSRLATATLGEQGQADTVLAATKEGTLFALDLDGSQRWACNVGAQLNDVAAANLSGDGRDEIVLARQDYNVAVLDPGGKELWKRPLAYYRRPPYVNLVRTGDIDGDGSPEVVAGGENWRFYAFEADGTELWNYESVHPSRSGAVADLDGDGKAEVICGTHYYWASVLGADGRQKWRHNLGPICYDIATGRFDAGGTRGVIFGSGDGKIYAVDSAGKPRLEYVTGDEVKHVAAADLDGDGSDEILAGSMNYNVYCFSSAGRRRWRLDAGGPISALQTVPEAQGASVLVGTGKGRLLSIDQAGTIRAISELGSEILDMAIAGPAAIVATADGRLTCISAPQAGLPSPQSPTARAVERE